MEQRLLAVDLGLRTGLALFDGEGRLLWARSHHFPDITRLKSAVWELLREARATELVAEGDTHLGRIWALAAEKQGAAVEIVQAQTWRRVMLLPREQRSGAEAKRRALLRAAEVVRRAGLPVRTMRDDTAEAILLGVWRLQALGWGAAEE